MITASQGLPSVSSVWRALEPVAKSTRSPWPACTESTATTYCSVGRFSWSCTRTTRSLSAPRRSSFCVATTLPTTWPISTATSSLRGQELDAVLRHDLVDEAPSQLLVHPLGHLLPARARAPARGPQQRHAAVEPHRSDQATRLGDRAARVEHVEQGLAQLGPDAPVAARDPAEVAFLLVGVRLLGL